MGDLRGVDEVLAGEAVPGVGGVLVDAEEAADDDRGQLGGQFDQGGVAGHTRADAEQPEAAGEPAGAEVLGGESAGEQPPLCCGVPGHRLGMECSQVAVEGRGHQDRDLSKTEGYLVAAELYVGGGEGGDTERTLGEQQGKQASRLVGDGDLVVVDETVDQAPPGVLGDELPGEGRCGDTDGQRPGGYTRTCSARCRAPGFSTTPTQLQSPHET
ncbi:hypothetical protein [Streptomyces sp. NPDC015345]|uniref:hypothetical protein n=1 Tax=Streptomyces sp. NPDC015345 TaxID=3364953 RepID=UPI00370246EE